jgi:hypothetical protein
MENILFSSWCTSMHSFFNQGLTDLFVEQELIKMITEKNQVFRTVCLYVMALHGTQNILLAIKLVLHSRKSYVLNQNKWVLFAVY